MAQGAATKVKKRKKSVLKRAKQSHVRAAINRANRTRVRSIMRRLRAAIDAKDSASAGNLLQPTLAAIDRAISKGVLEENTGNRYKSRLSLALNGLSAAAKA
jgi:small subunit ribosomal protein S20